MCCGARLPLRVIDILFILNDISQGYDPLVNSSASLVYFICPKRFLPNLTNQSPFMYLIWKSMDENILNENVDQHVVLKKLSQNSTL